MEWCLVVKMDNQEEEFKSPLTNPYPLEIVLLVKVDRCLNGKILKKKSKIIKISISYLI